MKRPIHVACSVCHSPLVDVTFASHRHPPMRNANRESAAGALGFSLPNSCSTWSMGLSSAVVAAVVALDWPNTWFLDFFHLSKFGGNCGIGGIMGTGYFSMKLLSTS